MAKSNSVYAIFLWFGMISSAYSMGLRSFVALPVEKGGAVIRFVYEHVKASDTASENSERLIANVAYGLSAKQTLLLGLPYRLSPSGRDRQGDVSVLYRHIVWQNDRFSGTDRLGLLAGVIAPTESDRDAAVQAGFVFTHFKNRNEIDLDVLYQTGMNDRKNSGRYDVSWQFRLLPSERAEWGLSPELNSVLELNGRWIEGHSTVHELTVGLQWIHQKWVLEGGIAKDISNDHESRYIMSTRFHF
ncbi:MAG: hypothetical protein HRT97_00385 [Moritella sp.]|uniref:hypothetical protein n=1 Tax=Moritella sp. TaxID=78556 RepID=UPI0025CD128E|nr:hypothetical protein [Moritella sp.]NQZ90783.1 hypothetical protein [Moritella sp.]